MFLTWVESANLVTRFHLTNITIDQNRPTCCTHTWQTPTQTHGRMSESITSWIFMKLAERLLKQQSLWASPVTSSAFEEVSLDLPSPRLLHIRRSSSGRISNLLVIRGKELIEFIRWGIVGAFRGWKCSDADFTIIIDPFFLWSVNRKLWSCGCSQTKLSNWFIK